MNMLLFLTFSLLYLNTLSVQLQINTSNQHEGLLGLTRTILSHAKNRTSANDGLNYLNQEVQPLPAISIANADLIFTLGSTLLPGRAIVGGILEILFNMPAKFSKDTMNEISYRAHADIVSQINDSIWAGDHMMHSEATRIAAHTAKDWPEVHVISATIYLLSIPDDISVENEEIDAYLSQLHAKYLSSGAACMKEYLRTIEPGLEGLGKTDKFTIRWILRKLRSLTCGYTIN